MAKVKSNVRVFQTHYTNHSPNPYEKKSDKPSEAVPNQSMTIQEIYKRYASGRPLMGVASPIFDDDGNSPYPLTFDDFMPDVTKMDLADRQEIMEMAKEHLEEVKKKLNNLAKSRNRAQLQKQQELEARIKELELKQPSPKPDTSPVRDEG